MKKILAVLVLIVLPILWVNRASGVEAIPSIVEEKVEKTGKISRDMKWTGFNSLKWIINRAINNGVEPETITMMIMLPLVATMVSFIHYIVGFTGYGIFMPTMLAVAFLNTGIPGGMLLFLLIFAVSLFSSIVTKKIKIHFWPARTINLLFISIGTFSVMGLISNLWTMDVSKISIFSILLIITLTEEFTRTELVKSKKIAKELTIGTLVLAIMGAGIMEVSAIKQFVLDFPEVTAFLILGFNLMVGYYGGIRLTEINRFKDAIRK